jgi:UbiD family decarboxylase
MAKPEPAQMTRSKWSDLREWLALVDSLGELKQVRGANSEEDIGAITEMLDHAEESPCVLFDEIPNYKPGYRVLVNGMGSRKRQALTLGLDTADASHERLLNSGANCSRVLRRSRRSSSNEERCKKIFCEIRM